MLQCKYRTSTGEFFNLMAPPYYITSLAPLFGYEDTPIEVGNVISGFDRKGIYQIPLELSIKGTCRSDVIAAQEAIYAAFENDKYSKKYGRLYVGNYYLDCYISGSSITNKVANARQMTLTVTTDKLRWVSEMCTYTMTDSSTEINPEEYEDTSVPFGLPFGFPNPNETKRINNTAATPCKFRIKIFGACENPSVTIGSNVYAVNVTLQTDECLIIDSATETIVKTRGADTTNCFALRDTSHDTFARVPCGEVTVNWADIAKLQLTLIDERSVPACD